MQHTGQGQERYVGFRGDVIGLAGKSPVQAVGGISLKQLDQFDEIRKQGRPGLSILVHNKSGAAARSVIAPVSADLHIKSGIRSVKGGSGRCFSDPLHNLILCEIRHISIYLYAVVFQYLQGVRMVEFHSCFIQDLHAGFVNLFYIVVHLENNLLFCGEHVNQ